MRRFTTLAALLLAGTLAQPGASSEGSVGIFTLDGLSFVVG